MNVMKKAKNFDPSSSIDISKFKDDVKYIFNEQKFKNEKSSNLDLLCCKTNESNNITDFNNSIQLLDTFVPSNNVSKVSTEINNIHFGNESGNNDDFKYEKKNIWHDLFSGFKPRLKLNRHNSCEADKINDQDFQNIDGLLMENLTDYKWRSKEDRSRNF